MSIFAAHKEVHVIVLAHDDQRGQHGVRVYEFLCLLCRGEWYAGNPSTDEPGMANGYGWVVVYLRRSTYQHVTDMAFSVAVERRIFL